MKALVFRFSAMGDVALTTPVLRGVLEQNNDLEITFVSNKAFEPLFQGIDRLHFYPVDLSKVKGLTGLFSLYKQLSKLDKWDKIIDLHSVMRTWVLGSFFKLAGKRVYAIDKGRGEKAELVTAKKRRLKPLTHSSQRYLEVFKEAGLDGELFSGATIRPSEQAKTGLDQFLAANGMEKKHVWIGIAPFSKHAEKEWPLEKVKLLIKRLIEDEEVRVLLLGGGVDEVSKLKKISSTYAHTQNFAGVLSLDEEIGLIHKLDCVIAMDSFNMHLAALCGTPVVSIWGATHPFAGFGPLNGNDRFIVETPTDELDCRPCSVFGNKKCSRGDLACLERIDVDMVMDKINMALPKA